MGQLVWSTSPKTIAWQFVDLNTSAVRDSVLRYGGEAIKTIITGLTGYMDWKGWMLFAKVSELF